jgi:hypothetical protein
MLQYVHQNKKLNEVYYNMMTKVLKFWNGSPIVKTWLPKIEVKSLSPHTYNIGYLV